MASKRHQRRKACEGKVKFSDFATASRAAYSYQRTFGHWMLAYKCDFCSGYHIGHPPRHIRQAINARRDAKWK